MTFESREIALLEKQSTDVLLNAHDYYITNAEEDRRSFDFLRAVKALQTKVRETFDPSINDAHKTWKGLIAKRDEHLKPLLEAERIVKDKSLEYHEEQERIRLEEERKAREKAEAEERKRRAELEAQAKKWEEKGNIEKAEERRAQAEQVHIPVAPIAEVEKSSGQIFRETWKAEVVDLKALVQAVANGKAPLALIAADQVALNKQAKATQDTFPIPGVKFFLKKEMAIR